MICKYTSPDEPIPELCTFYWIFNSIAFYIKTIACEITKYIFSFMKLNQEFVSLILYRYLIDGD